MQSVLITGGAGFIGQNLVHAWRAARPADRLVVVDAMTYAANIRSLEPLIEDGSIHFVKGDIGDAALMQRLFEEHAFTRVAHLAAESHVDRSISDPEAFLQTNVLGTFTLLKAALAAWRTSAVLDSARFLHVSTDEVYGSLGPADPAFTESSPYRPNSPYAASKAASDHLVRAFIATYGMPALITNCSNNYGAYQHPEKLIPLMIIHALEGKPLPIYGDGSNVRDWLHVSDHCDGADQRDRARPYRRNLQHRRRQRAQQPRRRGPDLRHDRCLLRRRALPLPRAFRPVPPPPAPPAAR